MKRKIVDLNYIFHCLVGFIYLMAFYSFYEQYPGLNSVNGLLPAESWIQRLENHIRSTGEYGSLAIFASDFQLPVDVLNEVVMLLGLLCSSLICIGWHHMSMFSVCWACYLSTHFIGQTFTSFQWDILLLEVGFVCIFSSSMLTFVTQKNSVLDWCFRFIAFKLMFESGVVKLQATCPTWENLSALEYHFATQCIPTPLAWFAHQLPPLLLRAAVACTLLIETPLAVALVAPCTLLRRIGCVLQWILQISILLTGNYNFFNMLTMTLMLKCWEHDDLVLSDAKRNKHSGKGEGFKSVISSMDDKGIFLGISSQIQRFELSTVGVTCQYTIFFIYILFSVIEMVTFGATNYGLSHPPMEWWRGDILSLRMKWEGLKGWIQPTCVAVIVVVLVQMASHWILRVIKLFGQRKLRSTFWCVFILPCLLFWEFFLGGFAIVWLSQSAIQFNTICDIVAFIPTPLVQLSSLTRSLSISSSYGLFRRMTGVGSASSSAIKTGATFSAVPSVVARPELILEGLNKATGEWLEIPFRYKPGDLFQPPPIIAPMQPRLDWQMWFAALGSYQHHPWLLNLIFKLLNLKHRKQKKAKTGQQDDKHEVGLAVEELEAPSSAVLDLLDRDLYPFKTAPPSLIRAVLYDYDFTRANVTWNTLSETNEIVTWSWQEVAMRALFTAKEFVEAFLRDEKHVQKRPKADSANGALHARNSTSGKGQWWSRRGRREFLPPIAPDNPSLSDFLKANGIDPRPKDVSLSAQYKGCLKMFNPVPVLTAVEAWQAIIPINVTSIAQSLHHTACSTLLLRSDDFKYISYMDQKVPISLVANVCMAIVFGGTLLNRMLRRLDRPREKAKKLTTRG